MNRFGALFSLLFLPASAAWSEEPLTGIPLPDSAIAVPKDLSGPFPATPLGERALKNARRSVSVALCGVEAHGASSDLDAGLIDFNVPDPARGADGETGEAKDQGKNARDYRSSIVLGVTLGYRF